ncbi:regulatory protein RecX [Lysinibacter cavernae]|uniref:Regulatory protein RecX n=1 Tax=Lysinibacter cavernae TaxID=1640652 RepID=A0A7X5TRI2_9MICO|nr:regulatory protein RecX [Lysinibacter cavernae]NIH52206.1 SOS response regulatory protein OraA/RecX [Lysinibacter cavernae]
MAVSFEPSETLAPVTDLSARFASKQAAAKQATARRATVNQPVANQAAENQMAVQQPATVLPSAQPAGRQTDGRQSDSRQSDSRQSDGSGAGSQSDSEPPRRTKLRAVRSADKQPSTTAHAQQPATGFGLAEAEAQPELSAEEIEDKALSRLARKALSEHEVRKAILGDGGSEDLADSLLADFNRKGYVNDETLAEDLVQAHLRRKKQGPAVIKRELAQRGIPDFIIAAALEVIDDDEELRLVVEAANDRVRRMGNLDRSVAERRLTGYLQRRGYSSSLIRSAVEQALGSKRSSPGSVRFE